MAKKGQCSFRRPRLAKWFYAPFANPRLLSNRHKRHNRLALKSGSTTPAFSPRHPATRRQFSRCEAILRRGKQCAQTAAVQSCTSSKTMTKEHKYMCFLRMEVINVMAFKEWHMCTISGYLLPSYWALILTNPGSLRRQWWSHAKYVWNQLQTAPKQPTHSLKSNATSKVEKDKM